MKSLAATAKQKEYITDMYTRYNRKVPDLDAITREQASRLIRLIKYNPESLPKNEVEHE